MVAIVLFLGLLALVVVWSKIDRARLDIDRARRDIDVLATRLRELERRSAPVSAAPAPRAPVPTPPGPPVSAPSPPVSAPSPPVQPSPIRAHPVTLPSAPQPAPALTPDVASSAASASPLLSATGSVSDLGGRLWGWLVGGNTVVRVGVIVLLFGVAFFLNFAIDQGWLPVEVRLMFAAAGGVALTAVGWRLRERSRDYALVLQGGGIGIVYLTVFAAANLYDLIATGPGLALMVVLVALSSALAVLQDARSLAVLATLAGFLAPVLMGQGGSHVALFAYYAVLNVGILAIAWFKAWRVLNLLGFACTFIFSAAWGAQYYQPEYFASTEPFLLAFFLCYVAVPVLFATRQQAAGTHYVDGTLLFGAPLVAFGLQEGLVRDFEYGMAFSALGVGTFYVALAWALWRRLPDAVRLFVESFLALGVAFGTLAIPLAFDGRLTGAAWALEGAGLLWIGIRQRRRLALGSGVLLQVAAGISFWLGIDGPARDVAILNSVFIGALLMSLAGLFSAWYLDRHRAAWSQTKPDVSAVLLGWGLLWWVGAGMREISTYIPNVDHVSAYVVFAAGSAAILTALRGRLAWRHLNTPVLVLLPVMVVIAVFSFADQPHPLVRWGSIAWGVALATHYWIQWRLESEWPADVANYWHAGLLWLGVFLASWEVAWWMQQVAGGATTWHHLGWAVVPCATIVGVPVLTRRVAWPFGRFAGVYLRALSPIVVFMAVWVLVTSVERGDPAPLPYVPLLNPLELAQCLILIIILQWTWADRTRVSEQALWPVWSILAFVVLNGLIARATHFYGGVEFDAAALWSSALYQTAVSVVWTVAALVAMLSATWLKQRAAWFAGAALLAAVVTKLFLIDLNDVGTVARIVSFLFVGLLILVVGYLSPLPPRSKEETPS